MGARRILESSLRGIEQALSVPVDQVGSLKSTQENERGTNHRLKEMTQESRIKIEGSGWGRWERKGGGTEGKVAVLNHCGHFPKESRDSYLNAGIPKEPCPSPYKVGDCGQGFCYKKLLETSPHTPFVTVPVFVSLQSLSHVETKEEGNPTGNGYSRRQAWVLPHIRDPRSPAPRTQAFREGVPGKRFDRVAVLWSPPPPSVSAPRAAGFKCAQARALLLLPRSAAGLEPRRSRGASLLHPPPLPPRPALLLRGP